MNKQLKSGVLVVTLLSSKYGSKWTVFLVIKLKQIHLSVCIVYLIKIAAQHKSPLCTVQLLRGTRYRHFLECRRLRNVKILPLHPTSPRGHQKMRQDLPHLSVPFTKREIEAKYFILSPLSAAPALFLSFFHRNVNYCSFMRNTCSSITYKVGNK